MKVLPRLRRTRAGGTMPVVADEPRAEPRPDTIRTPTLRWINIDEPRLADRQWLADTFGFHELDLEDVASHNQRPKVDEYPNYLFIVMQFPRFDKERGRPSRDPSPISSPSTTSIGSESAPPTTAAGGSRIGPPPAAVAGATCGPAGTGRRSPGIARDVAMPPTHRIFRSGLRASRMWPVDRRRPFNPYRGRSNAVDAGSSPNGARVPGSDRGVA